MGEFHAGDEGADGEGEQEQGHAEAGHRAGGAGGLQVLDAWARGLVRAGGFLLEFGQAGWSAVAVAGRIGILVGGDRELVDGLLAGHDDLFLLGELELEVDVAEPDGHAVAQRDDALALAVELGAVGRVEVAQLEAAGDALELGVIDGDRRAVDDDVVFAAAAEAGGLAVGLEAVGLGLLAWDGDGDARHGEETD